MTDPADLRSELTATLNRHSAENGSDTPDFILAAYLMSCLDAFDAAVTARDEWFDRAKHVVLGVAPSTSTGGDEPASKEPNQP